MNEIKISNAVKTITITTDANTVGEVITTLINDNLIPQDTTAASVVLFEGEYVEAFPASIKESLRVLNGTELGVSCDIIDKSAQESSADNQAVETTVSVTVTYGAGIVAPIHVTVRGDDSTVRAAITSPSVLNILNKSNEAVLHCRVTVNGQESGTDRTLLGGEQINIMERVAGEKGSDTDGVSACTLSVTDRTGETRGFVYSSAEATLSDLLSSDAFRTWLRSNFNLDSPDTDLYKGALIVSLNGISARSLITLLVRSMHLGKMAHLVVSSQFRPASGCPAPGVGIVPENHTSAAPCCEHSDDEILGIDDDSDDDTYDDTYGDDYDGTADDCSEDDVTELGGGKAGTSVQQTGTPEDCSTAHADGILRMSICQGAGIVAFDFYQQGGKTLAELLSTPTILTRLGQTEADLHRSNIYVNGTLVTDWQSTVLCSDSNIRIEARVAGEKGR